MIAKFSAKGLKAEYLSVQRGDGFGHAWAQEAKIMVEIVVSRGEAKILAVQSSPDFGIPFQVSYLRPRQIFEHSEAGAASSSCHKLRWVCNGSQS